MAKTARVSDVAKVYKDSVHSSSPADDDPLMTNSKSNSTAMDTSSGSDSSSSVKTILRPRQAKTPSKVISPQIQEQIQNDVRSSAFLSSLSTAVKRNQNNNKPATKQNQIQQNSKGKVLVPKQKVLKPTVDETRVEDIKQALLHSDASSNGLNDHIHQQGLRVFDGGNGSIPLQELAMDTIDVEMKSTEDVVETKKDKGQPVSHVIFGKVVLGDMEAMLDLLSQHLSDKFHEETGIFMSRAYWFLHSDERQAVPVLRKKVLGHGSYGVVELFCHGQTEFVKKQVRQNFQVNEVSITATLDNPYIIRSFGMTIRQKIKTILMENWGTSLLQCTCSLKRKFLESEIWDLTFQGLTGLEYLHQFGIRHHDIKPENLLLKEVEGKFLLKIADFGAAKWSTEANDMEGWTPDYLSPERAWFLILKKYPSHLQATGNEDATITDKSDVFSFGLSMCFPYDKCHIMLKYICDGKNITNEDQLNEARLHMLIEIVANPGLAITLIPDSVGPEMRLLLKKMLAGSFEERSTAGQAKRLMYSLSEESEVKRQNENRENAALDETRPEPAMETVSPVTTVQSAEVQQPKVSVQPTTQQLVVGLQPVTLQPVTQQPIVSLQPVTQQPVVSLQPVTQQPVVSLQPLTQKPVTPQPVVSLKPVSQQPVVSLQPVTQQPVASLQPVTQQPVVSLQPIITEIQPPVTSQPAAEGINMSPHQALSQTLEPLQEVIQMDNEKQVSLHPDVLNCQENTEPLKNLVTQVEVINLQQQHHAYYVTCLPEALSPATTMLIYSPQQRSVNRVILPRIEQHQQPQSQVQPSSSAQHVGTPSAIASGSGNDWMSMAKTIKQESLGEYPEGLTRRMVKRKLLNKLPAAAKKQKTQEETRKHSRSNRRLLEKSIPERNLEVAEQEEGASEVKDNSVVFGNLPDLGSLF